jgi:sulfate transport system ATP-binding protein
VAGFVGASNVLRGAVVAGALRLAGTAVAETPGLPDGLDAVAYVRPHDIEVGPTPRPMAFPITVERRTDMGWVSKLNLRLEDGQALVAQLPNEDVGGVEEGNRLFAIVRDPKVFGSEQADAVPELIA